MNKTKFFSKKKIIWIIIIVLIGGSLSYFLTRPKKADPNIQTVKIKKQDIESTVLATGQVISKTNLNLSFQGGGVVKSLKVKVGDQVKEGQILGTLEQNSARAALISAQGNLAQARANYNKISVGASQEEINIARQAVNSSQVAYQNALSQLEITKKSTSASIAQAQKNLADLKSPTIQTDSKRSTILVNIANQLARIGTDLNQEKIILDDNNLKDTFGVMNTNSLNNFKTAYSQINNLLLAAKTALNTAQAYKSDTNISNALSTLQTVSNQSLISLNACYSALQNSIVSSKFSQSQLNSYEASISQAINTENSGLNLINSSYQVLSAALISAQNTLTNTKLASEEKISSLENQIKSAQAAVEQSKATLQQKTAPARSSDLAVAKAQIISAQGNLNSAQVKFNNTILKAPLAGKITAVDTKIGQQVSALTEVIVLKNMDSLHSEVYVSEANIADLKIGQTVDYTFDALGPDRHFSGKIYEINPASSIISGVVNYLVKASLKNIPEIKPGMTANITILVASKKQVLAIPSSAIIYQGNERLVRLITDSASKTYTKIPVQTGLEADSGLTELISGLKAGDEIVSYIKS